MKLRQAMQYMKSYVQYINKLDCFHVIKLIHIDYTLSKHFAFLMIPKKSVKLIIKPQKKNARTKSFNILPKSRMLQTERSCSAMLNKEFNQELHKYFFISLLKIEGRNMSFILAGMLFQSLAPLQPIELSAVLVLNLGIV